MCQVCYGFMKTTLLKLKHFSAFADIAETPDNTHECFTLYDA